MLAHERSTRQGDFDCERCLLHRGLDQRLPNPLGRRTVHANTSPLDEQMGLPHTERRQPSTVPVSCECVSDPLRQALRLEEAPQPDACRAAGSLERVPGRRVFYRGDEVVLDSPPPAHRSQPGRPAGRDARRDDVRQGLAEARHAQGPSSGAHPVERSQTGRFELRNGDLVHGKIVPRSMTMVTLILSRSAHRCPSIYAKPV